MKYIPKPNTEVPKPVVEELPPPPVKDISIDRLIEDGLVALYREMKNILRVSVNGKLDAATAKDLRDHMKLLFELKDAENSSLKGLTDEALKAKAKAALDET